MTEGNRKQNIADALLRAGQALEAAEALTAAGLYADAISRAYYAAFHFLRALLYSEGIEARTHSGSIHLLNQHFVRSGRIDSRHNRVLAGLQRSRELADYDPAVTFSAKDVAAQIADARGFGGDVRAVLRAGGWAS